jgi:hypothetical protein
MQPCTQGLGQLLQQHSLLLLLLLLQLLQAVYPGQPAVTACTMITSCVLPPCPAPLQLAD